MIRVLLEDCLCHLLGVHTDQVELIAQRLTLMHVPALLEQFQNGQDRFVRVPGNVNHAGIEENVRVQHTTSCKGHD